jgi:branched-chain amino acid transport system permease protein
MTAPLAPGLAAAQALANRHRFRWWEALPWVAALAAYFVFPTYLSFGTQVLITILFALSLDLVMGYAGIITLGHAAFFGAGAYTVGILALHFGWNEPLSGLLAAGVVAGVIGFASGMVLLRTQGLTLLMVTLCTMALLEEGANMGAAYTGGFDGMPGLSFTAIFGVFEFDPLFFRVQYLYALGVLLVCFVVVRMLIYSPFGQSLTGIRENVLRMHAVGAPVQRRLVIAYTISAALAGIAGGVFTQATAFVNLSVLGLDRAAGVLIILILGGYGRLYGAFVGAIVYMVLEHTLSQAYPTAWQLGIGIVLIVVALYARNGILGIAERLRTRVRTRSPA